MAGSDSRYLAFFKPCGVLCQFTAEVEGQRTLADFIPVPGVYPVGRLDRDSEGLLLFTDDGPLAHRLTDPSFAHPRTYLVQVEARTPPSPEAMAALRRGVTLGGKDGPYRTRPARVEVIAAPDLPPRAVPIRERKAIGTAWLSMTLTEGKNRQVRHMTAAVGHPTLRLVRWAMGALTLAGLAPGDWRELTDAEVGALRDPTCRRPRSPGPGRSG